MEDKILPMTSSNFILFFQKSLSEDMFVEFLEREERGKEREICGLLYAPY